MANIKPYVDQILSAVYGEEVRSSLGDALTAMNNDLTADTASAQAAAARAEAAVAQIADVREEVAELVAGLEQRNLLKDPVGLGDTYWYAYGTITRGIVDPTGSADAIRLAVTSGRAEAFFQADSGRNKPITRTNQGYAFSVWLKADAAKTINLELNGQIHTVDLTTAWKRYVIYEEVDTVTSRGHVGIGGYSSLTSGWVEIYYPCVVYADMANVAYSGSGFDLIDYDALADAILDKLTTKTYADVNRGTRTLIDAINGIIESGTINNPSLSWPLANSAGEVGDRPYARAFKLGNASSGNQDLSLLYYPAGSTSYKTNKIFDSSGVFLPNPILRQAHVQKVTATASGTVVADGTIRATATITTVSGASDYLLIPIACNFGYVTGVSRSGTTITVNMRNLTAAARTMAATIAVIPLRGDNNT